MKTLFAFAALAIAAGAQAQVITIDQAKALAGNVTPGDAPGFPITISQPGSYRLTGNLNVDNVALGGIDIRVPNVSMDLGGFVIRGARCGPQRCVIDAPRADGVAGNGSSFDVLNGRIENFSGLGVYASGGATLRNLTVRNNGGCGAGLNHLAQVFDSRFTGNLGCGVGALSGIVRGNQISGNSQSQVEGTGSVLATGNVLIGPQPMKSLGAGSVVSSGDNLCTPQYGPQGSRC